MVRNGRELVGRGGRDHTPYGRRKREEIRGVAKGWQGEGMAGEEKGGERNRGWKRVHNLRKTTPPHPPSSDGW